MKDQNGFKPFIPANKVVPEMTAVSIALGIVLAVLFGAANAYLGLRVGKMCIRDSKWVLHESIFSLYSDGDRPTIFRKVLL